MTDAERLKVAEELLAAILRGKIDLPDVYVTYSHASKTYYVNRSKSQQSLLASDSDVITAIILARQKLAAEREAAMTPRERKLRDRVTQIRDYVKNFGDWDKTIIRLCDEALEES